MKYPSLICVILLNLPSFLFSEEQDLKTGKYDLVVMVNDNESKFSGYLTLAKHGLVYTSVGIEDRPMILKGRISEVDGAVTFWSHHEPEDDEDTPHSHHFHGKVTEGGVIEGEGMVTNLLTPTKIGWKMVPAKE